MQVRVTCYRTKLGSFHELMGSIDRREPLPVKPCSGLQQLKIAPQPFSNTGALRLPFYAVPAGGCGGKCVVKRFRMHFGETLSEVGWMPGMDARNVRLATRPYTNQPSPPHACPQTPVAMGYCHTNVCPARAH